MIRGDDKRRKNAQSLYIACSISVSCSLELETLTKIVYYNWDLINRNTLLTCYSAVVWEHSDIAISPKGQETWLLRQSDRYWQDRHWKTPSKLILNVHKLCQIFTADSSGINFAVQVLSLFQINCLNVYLSCKIISHVSCQRVPRSSQTNVSSRAAPAPFDVFLVMSPLSKISATVLVRICYHSQKNVLRTKHPSYNKRINYPLN